MQANGLVGNLDMVKEDGQIRIFGGLPKELNRRVLEVDRRKRLANVELEIAGSIHNIWFKINL